MRMPGTVTSIPNQDSITISDGRRTTLEDPDMNPASGTPEGSCSAARDEACLQHKHKVFLSHSGAQKNFVEQLCADLERCDRCAFYDKRRDGLKRDEYSPGDGLERDDYSPGDGLERDEYSPEVIFRATRQCQVGVLILSEEYFTATKWSMLELAAMVDFKKQNSEFVILPVFLGISREQCRNIENHKRWESVWLSWKETDPQIDVEKWKKALLLVVSQINGLIYDEMLGEVKFRDEIVEVIRVLPDTGWDESKVQGRSRLCQGEGELVEVDPPKHRVETPRNGSEVEELQARAFLNSSDEIQDEHRGQSKLEAELHVIDMVCVDIPLNFEATTFEVIMDCLISSVEGVEAQVAEFSRLHSGNHIQVFNHECDSLVGTLSGTVHDRLRRYKNTLSLVQVAEVNERRRIFMSVAFCIVALTELECMFKAVVDLLTMCSKKDWWNTALELSNTLPSHTIPRWSSFSLAIRSCEWSMDIADFGFHSMEQFLAGASTMAGVVFKWSDKQSRMVLHIDGKPLYHDEGGSSLLDVTRNLEGKDVTALIEKLVELNETRKRTLLKRFSKADANMHIIADVLSQKLHGPRPEPNSVPYTFRVNPSKLKIQKFIGSGSYGCVAECKWLGRTVSVKKVIMPGLSRKLFEMEAAILATVQHPRVVRMIGCAFEEKEGTGSLVMELMEDDLRHVIEKRCPKPARGVSPFPLRVAIDIMLQMGEGMQYLREHKILHRDLKAKNVLLNRCRTSKCGAYGKFQDLASLLHTEESYIVKLADFGKAKARRKQTIFETKAGTTVWMAPEVYRIPDAQNYEWPADVYSFAMTCYEILTGCTPFAEVHNTELYKRIVAGDRPPLDGVKIPPLLKDLVERCWKTNPNERPNFDEICKTLWQCKVEIILPVFELQMGPSQAESV